MRNASCRELEELWQWSGPVLAFVPSGVVSGKTAGGPRDVQTRLSFFGFRIVLKVLRPLMDARVPRGLPYT